MRKINVSKPISVIPEEILECLLLGTITKIFHEIEFVDEAKAKDGPATIVRLTSRTDFPPDADVACMIHIIPHFNDAFGEQMALHPDLHAIIAGFDLWYWKDRFWVKGVDSLGIDYYSKIKDKKCYALCPVDVANGDQLLSKIAD